MYPCLDIKVFKLANAYFAPALFRGNTVGVIVNNALEIELHYYKIKSDPSIANYWAQFT